MQSNTPIMNEAMFNAYANAMDKPPWGWNWLERWMASQQPFQVSNTNNTKPGQNDQSTYITATSTGDVSERTVEMDMVDPPHLRDPTKFILRYTSYSSCPKFLILVPYYLLLSVTCLSFTILMPYPSLWV